MVMAAKSLKQRKPKKTSDAYVGMLFISLVAFIGGAVLLYMDYNQYSSNNPPPVKAGAGSPSRPGPGSQSPSP
jgi:hypothetical protein